MNDDILKRIYTSLDPDELVDRLGIDIETLVYKLESEIMSKLDAFEDICSSDEDE